MRPSMDLKSFKKVRAHFGETPAKSRFRPNNQLKYSQNMNEGTSKTV